MKTLTAYQGSLRNGVDLRMLQHQLDGWDFFRDVTSPDPMLEIESWGKRWSATAWRWFLADPESKAVLGALRHSTHTGRPLGSTNFVAALEELAARPLCSAKGSTSQETAAIAGKPALSRLLLKTEELGPSHLSPRCWVN